MKQIIEEIYKDDPKDQVSPKKLIEGKKFSDYSGFFIFYKEEGGYFNSAIYPIENPLLEKISYRVVSYDHNGIDITIYKNGTFDFKETGDRTLKNIFGIKYID